MKKIASILLTSFLAFICLYSVVKAYNVVSGDTMWKIAENADLSLTELIILNPQVNDPNLIYPGQEIILGNAEDGILGGTLPVAGTTYHLAGSGITSSATSITLQSLTIPQTGYELQDADFSSTFYITLEPGNTKRQEIAACTTVTQNANDTATLSGCSRGMAPYYPYTASTTYAFSHAGGTAVIFSDAPQLFEEYAAKNNEQIITGLWYFDIHPKATSTLGTPTTTYQYVTKEYADLIANQGAATSTESVAGISELATRVESVSSTMWGANDPHVQQSEHATSTPSSNISSLEGGLWDVWSESDGKINQSWLDLTEAYAWTGVHSWSGLTIFTATTTMATTTMDEIISASTTLNGNIFFSGIDATQLTDGSDVAVTVHNHSGLDSFVSSSPMSVTFGNSISETELWSVSIPANTLGTNGIVEYKAYISNFGIEASGQSCEIFTGKIKYGGTTVGTFTIDNDAAGDIASMQGWLEGKVMGAGTTGSQTAVGFLRVEDDINKIDSGGSPTNQSLSIGSGTASIDSTSSQTLQFTADWGGADAACTITMQKPSIVKYPNN